MELQKCNWFPSYVSQNIWMEESLRRTGESLISSFFHRNLFPKISFSNSLYTQGNFAVTLLQNISNISGITVYRTLALPWWQWWCYLWAIRYRTYELYFRADRRRGKLRRIEVTHFSDWFWTTAATDWHIDLLFVVGFVCLLKLLMIRVSYLKVCEQYSCEVEVDLNLWAKHELRAKQE